MAENEEGMEKAEKEREGEPAKGAATRKKAAKKKAVKKKPATKKKTTKKKTTKKKSSKKKTAKKKTTSKKKTAKKKEVEKKEVDTSAIAALAAAAAKAAPTLAGPAASRASEISDPPAPGSDETAAGEPGSVAETAEADSSPDSAAAGAEGSTAASHAKAEAPPAEAIAARETPSPEPAGEPSPPEPAAVSKETVRMEKPPAGESAVPEEEVPDEAPPKAADEASLPADLPEPPPANRGLLGRLTKLLAGLLVLSLFAGLTIGLVMYYRATLFHEEHERQAGAAVQPSTGAEQAETGEVNASSPMATSLPESALPAADGSALREGDEGRAAQGEGSPKVAGPEAAGETGSSPSSPLMEGEPATEVIQSSAGLERPETEATAIPLPQSPAPMDGTSPAAPASGTEQGGESATAMQPVPVKKTEEETAPAVTRAEPAATGNSGERASASGGAAAVPAGQAAFPEPADQPPAARKAAPPPVYGYPGWRQPRGGWGYPRPGGGYYPGYSRGYPRQPGPPVY